MGMDERAWSRGRNGLWFSREEWAAEQTRSAIGYHVTLRLADDGGIARTPGGLRVASRLVLKHGEERGLVAHRFADNHEHSLLLCTREEAGTFANVVEGALRRCLHIGVPFQPARIRRIADERHLTNSFPYLFRQEEHHGTAFDLLHDGSSLLDLLGMRMGSPWLAPRVRAALPRLNRDTLVEWLDAPGLDDEPMDVHYLADAAAGAWGVPDLRGNSAPSIRARRVAIHMLDRLAPNLGVMSTLGIPTRSAWRYRHEVVSDAEIRAVELQLKLRGLIDRRRKAA
jgi:hypothetical protein